MSIRSINNLSEKEWWHALSFETSIVMLKGKKKVKHFNFLNWFDKIKNDYGQLKQYLKIQSNREINLI